MSHLTTTTELLASLRRGHDEPMWTLFVERYRPVLVGVACALGLSVEDAQDAAQQTLLEFVRDFGAGRYDRTRGRLRTWLLSILRHRVADLRRLRARSRPGAAPPSESGGRQDVDLGAENELEQIWQAEVQRRLLDEAWRRLRAEGHVAERSLRAFELTVLRDMPLEAAAEACGLTLSAVYVARSRVAQRLRRIVHALTLAYDDDRAA